MERFVVTTREVHYCSYGVDAENETDAITRVRSGEGEIVNDSLSYSETLAPGEIYECKVWDVTREADNG